MRGLADLISPVVPVLPHPEGPAEPVKFDLFACDNSACCASLPWGLLKCPRCGAAQQRVRSAVVEGARA